MCLPRPPLYHQACLLQEKIIRSDTQQSDLKNMPECRRKTGRPRLILCFTPQDESVTESFNIASSIVAFLSLTS